jgi:S1-C subfamily serine protease
MPGDFEFDDEPDDRVPPRRGSREFEPPRRDGYAPRQAKSGPTPLLIISLLGGTIMLVAVVVVGVLVVRKATSETKPAASGATTVAQTSLPRPAPPAKKEPDPVDGSPTPAVVEKVKKATVRVRVLFNNNKGGSGTGFVEKDSRLILTNAHVLGLMDKKDRGPRAIELVVNSGEGPDKEYSLGGELVAVDKESDLALIRPVFLEPGARHVVPEGLTVPKSPNVTLLQRLFVFGYPFGERLGTEITVSETSVSSLRKDPATGKLAMVQVKGGMNPGNSGGPVVDARGNVVGVAVAGIQGTDINFAIPGEVVQEFIARKRN